MDKSQNEAFGPPHLRAVVICETCGGEFYKPPSQALGRRFCDNICYDNRRTVAQPTAIIRILGGVQAVSEHFRMRPDRIERWGFRGFPRVMHGPILALAKQKGLEKLVTQAQLDATLEFARAHALGMVGRKASKLGPSRWTYYRHRRKHRDRLE